MSNYISTNLIKTNPTKPAIHFHALFVQFLGWSIHLLQEGLQSVDTISLPEQNQPKEILSGSKPKLLITKLNVLARKAIKHTSLDDMSGSHEKFTLMSPRTSPLLEGLLPPKKTPTLTE